MSRISQTSYPKMSDNIEPISEDEFELDKSTEISFNPFKVVDSSDDDRADNFNDADDADNSDNNDEIEASIKNLYKIGKSKSLSPIKKDKSIIINFNQSCKLDRSIQVADKFKLGSMKKSQPKLNIDFDDSYETIYSENSFAPVEV